MYGRAYAKRSYNGERYNELFEDIVEGVGMELDCGRSFPGVSYRHLLYDKYFEIWLFDKCKEEKGNKISFCLDDTYHRQDAEEICKRTINKMPGFFRYFEDRDLYADVPVKSVSQAVDEIVYAARLFKQETINFYKEEGIDLEARLKEFDKWRDKITKEAKEAEKIKNNADYFWSILTSQDGLKSIKKAVYKASIEGDETDDGESYEIETIAYPKVVNQGKSNEKIEFKFQMGDDPYYNISAFAELRLEKDGVYLSFDDGSGEEQNPEFIDVKIESFWDITLNVQELSVWLWEEAWDHKIVEF